MIHIVKLPRLETRFSSFLAFLLISLLFTSFSSSVVPKESTCTYLSMNPLAHVAHEIGELFDVAIDVSFVENLHSLGFTLTYNQSLIDVEQVIQGTFFPSPPESLFEYAENELRGSVTVNMSLAAPGASRNGNGTLAWIVFRTVEESYGGSPISFEQALLSDSALKPITHDSVGAVYFWKSVAPDPPAEGRVIDLYTQKGGKGPNEPGGDFVAGELVYLVSQVTYDGNPVQQKLVAFEVRNPSNESVLFRGATTDADGLANISFRIPILMSSNGTWTAVSAVDIREEVVWDTMSFRVYLGHVPVGGYSVPTEKHSVEKPLTINLLLLAVLTAVFTVIERKKPRKCVQCI